MFLGGIERDQGHAMGQWVTNITLTKTINVQLRKFIPYFHHIETSQLKLTGFYIMETMVVEGFITC